MWTYVQTDGDMMNQGVTLNRRFRQGVYKECICPLQPTAVFHKLLYYSAVSEGTLCRTVTTQLLI